MAAIHASSPVTMSSVRQSTATTLQLQMSDILWMFLVLPAAGACGSMLWLSFFPHNLGWPAWFALVPLLALVRWPMPTWVSLLAAMFAGVAFLVPALQWMRVAHPMMRPAWFALAAYCALYFPIAIWLLRRCDRIGAPMALAAPVVWVSMEYLRSHFLTGFAWYFLGHTQHDFLAIIQVTDLGGVYAVSFLVAAVNGAIFDVLCRLGFVQRLLKLSAPRGPVFRPAIAVAALFAASLGYGAWRLNQNDFAEGPRVTLLQSNIPQDIKNERNAGGNSANQLVQHTKDLTDKLLREKTQTDLIIWPETMFTQEWLAIEDGTPPDDLPPDLPKEIAYGTKTVASVAKYSRAHVLLGLNTVQFGPGLKKERFNSALLVHRDGPVLGRYDKIHRVLFGEYLPMRQTLPFMKVFSPYPHDYSLTAGKRFTRFNLPTNRGEFRFGVLICYEDSDPLLARQYANDTDDGPPVDFLVNISNDGWFDGTEEHELHLAICRFRAIEARRAVVRSVNMGISAAIDGNGRVIALPGASWAASKKVAATVTTTVPIDTRTSLYARVGDCFAVACALGCIALVIASRQRASR